MDGEKSILASRTFWAAVATIVLAVAPLLNIDLGLNDQQLADKLYEVGTVISGILTIVFRLTTTKKVTLPGAASRGPTPA